MKDTLSTCLYKENESILLCSEFKLKSPGRIGTGMTTDEIRELERTLEEYAIDIETRIDIIRAALKEKN